MVYHPLGDDLFDFSGAIQTSTVLFWGTYVVYHPPEQHTYARDVLLFSTLHWGSIGYHPLNDDFRYFLGYCSGVYCSVLCPGMLDTVPFPLMSPPVGCELSGPKRRPLGAEEEHLYFKHRESGVWVAMLPWVENVLDFREYDFL